MGKKFVKILVVILILGGVAGGAYYFTDGFGTKNTSIIGNWQRSEKKYEGNGVVWKFFENGTLFLGKANIYCTYEINGDILKVDIDPLDMANGDLDIDCEIEYSYKIERNSLTLKNLDNGEVLNFKKE